MAEAQPATIEHDDNEEYMLYTDESGTHRVRRSYEYRFATCGHDDDHIHVVFKGKNGEVLNEAALGGDDLLAMCAQLGIIIEADDDIEGETLQ